jgi:hypothetical protein
MKDTVNFPMKYSDYPIAFYPRIFYFTELLNAGVVQRIEFSAKDTAGGN